MYCIMRCVDTCSLQVPKLGRGSNALFQRCVDSCCLVKTESRQRSIHATRSSLSLSLSLSLTSGQLHIVIRDLKCLLQKNSWFSPLKCDNLIVKLNKIYRFPPLGNTCVQWLSQNFLPCIVHKNWSIFHKSNSEFPIFGKPIPRWQWKSSGYRGTRVPDSVLRLLLVWFEWPRPWGCPM